MFLARSQYSTIRTTGTLRCCRRLTKKRQRPPFIAYWGVGGMECPILFSAPPPPLLFISLRHRWVGVLSGHCVKQMLLYQKQLKQVKSIKWNESLYPIAIVVVTYLWFTGKPGSGIEDRGSGTGIGRKKLKIEWINNWRIVEYSWIVVMWAAGCG